MKKVILMLAAGTMMFAACENAPKADQANASDAQEVTATEGVNYGVNTTESIVEWVGTKPVGKHNGFVKISEGNLIVTNNALTGGSFTIDMNTLEATDQDADGNGKLSGHLKSPDFLDVEAHPTAKFEITGVTEGVDASNNELVMTDATHTVTGNLTLKGETKSITFPAIVKVDDNTITANSTFNIDRTQWGINYGNDQSLGDKFINPIVNITVKLSAAK